MSEDSSTSDSETSACSSKFDPMKALYSDKTKVPIQKAPMYENIQQFEASLTNAATIIPVGQAERVRQREEEKTRRQLELERELDEINKQRFAQYQGMIEARQPKVKRNVLTRIGAAIGPLSALKHCVDNRLRIKVLHHTGLFGREGSCFKEPCCVAKKGLDKHLKNLGAVMYQRGEQLSPQKKQRVCYQVITRNHTGVRGELYANLVAFDKQWNLALTDVLEVWKRKAMTKRKIPPALGVPVEKGTAASISPVPLVTETPLGGGVWECTRHMAQILVRGEHVVLINIVD